MCAAPGVQVCIIWKLDEERKKFHVVAATPNVNGEFRAIELPEEIAHHLLKTREGQVSYLSDVRQPHKMYNHSKYAAERGWVSLLTTPVRIRQGDRLLGTLDVYTTNRRQFKEWEKEFLVEVANITGLRFRAVKNW